MAAGADGAFRSSAKSRGALFKLPEKGSFFVLLKSDLMNAKNTNLN
jgi:hypothetical protein